MDKPVILTGLRANNDLHIGHYFGALMSIIDMSKHKSADYQINLFIPDLHSFTTPIDHNQLQANIMNNLKMFCAAGLDLDTPNLFVYRQSYIPAHSEMTWILDCFTGFGEMQRMTQFKDKSSDLNDDRISVGLFNYPVLMAADILIYSASYIPVGEDQTQHLEFTRDLAIRLNNQFGELFTVPKPVAEQHKFFARDQALRIKDLADPTKKMSKSDVSGKGVIFMTDDPELARKKIMSATTDSLGSINYQKAEQPGISNLLELNALLSERELSEVIEEYKGQTSYGNLKTTVADSVAKLLSDFQAKLASISDEAILTKLQSSEAYLNPVANKALYKVQKAVGLRS